MSATDARPVPRKNAAFRFYFAVRKPSDGTLITGWTGADSEVSLDGAAFSDCTNEATEIGTTGCGYIDLTSSEMNADAVVYKLTVTNTGAVPLVFTFFPEEVGDYRADAVQLGGSTQSLTDLKDFADDGYDPSTNKVQGVVTTDTATAVTTVNGLANNVITAASIAADAITDAKVASDVTIASVTGSVGSIATGGITSTSFAAGAIDNAAIAADAIGASELAASAVTEIQSGLSTLDAAGVRAAVGLASANLDTQLAALADAVDTEIGTLQSTLNGAVTTLGTAGNGLTAIPWNAAWDAEVQSEVQDAIEANHLDHLLAQTYDPASKPGAADALLNELIGNDGGVSQFTANALELAPSGSGSGSGSGAYTLTITVNDGSTALQNATVRMVEGANNFTATTNASGIATFSLDAATYSVAITKDGYQFTPTTKVVSGTGSQTYSMTAVTITPPTNPALSAIEVLCLDSSGQPESGIDVDIRIAAIPTGSQNIAFKGTKQTATSDVDGIARFEVVQGSVCEWKRGAADVWERVSIDSDGVTSITSVIGSP